MLQELEQELESQTDKEKAALLQRFFKTGKGEYGEGDVFLGVIVPKQRQIAKKFKELEMSEIQELLNSKVHEKRLIALLILVEQFKKSGGKGKQKIFDFYLNNTKKINNWDLVDLSAPNIIGAFLLDKKRDVLYELARSENLWEKRISIISTAAFIRNKDFEETIKISEILLKDEQDLIHKAVGWMLREVGKKDEECLIKFLNRNYKIMPRTMLRYSIEKFPEEKRQKYLKGEI
ncbi:DNA alkylation repair protein [Candidatus Pacearchaeota archaeon RBG_13_36_9]|nr:MAG: DNA alkylation repair protein [Candidatus Pacearchaeota archaeon RBG_13_36_9]